MRVRTPLAVAHDCPGLGTRAPGPRAREPAPAPATRRPDSHHSNPTTCAASRLGQAAPDPGAPMVCQRAGASEDRHTRHGGALAPAGLAPLLALAVPLPRWPS